MAHRAPALALLGLLALIAAGGIWLAVRDTGGDAALTGTGRAARGDADEKRESLESITDPAPERASEPRLAAAARPVADVRGNFDTADALFVDVTIVRPPGTPADEVLELIAYSAKRTDGTEEAFADEGLTQQLQRFAAPVAAEVRVSLFETSGLMRLTRLDGATRRAGPDGTFEFVDLRAGTCVLRAGVEGNFAGSGHGYGSIVSAPWTLETDGALTGIELRLKDAGRIEGLVRDTDGTPAAGASVYVRNARGELLSPFPRATTDAVGRFVHKNVAPGEVTVSARLGEQAAADTGPVVVRAGEVSEVELALEAGTVLVITVQDEAGEDVRAAISVTDADGREMAEMLSATSYEDALTGGISTRELRVGPLAPGRYTVVAAAADGALRKKRVTLRGKPETRVRIKLKE